MPTHLVAMDLGERAARVLVVESALRSSELVSAATFERTDEEESLDFLKRVRSELPERVDTLITNADPTSLSTRQIQLPFSDLRKVEQTLVFELDDQLPFEVEDVATAWHISERSKKSTKVLVAVSPKEKLSARLADLAAADLEPRVVVPPASVLADLLPKEHPEAAAVVSLGASQSHVAVVSGGLRFTRTMRVGGDSLDRFLAKKFDITPSQAREARHREAQILLPHVQASPEEQELSDALIQGLTPLVTGLATTFKALPLEDAPERLYLTGGLSRLPGLVDYLAQELGIEVELIDVQGALSHLACKEPLAPEYSLAAAMIAANMRHGRGVPLNMRRGEFAYAGDLQLFRGEALRLGVGVALVVLLALVSSVVRLAMLSAEEEEVTQGICQATKRIIGQEICDPTRAVSAISQPAAAGSFVIPTYSAADLFEMMSKAIGNDLDVSFDNLELKLEPAPDEPDRISGKGETGAFETADGLVAALKKDKCVTEVEISKQKRTRNERIEFSFSMEVECPPGYLLGSELGPVEEVPPPAETPTDQEEPSAAQDIEAQKPRPPIPGLLNSRPKGPRPVVHQPTPIDNAADAGSPTPRKIEEARPPGPPGFTGPGVPPSLRRPFLPSRLGKVDSIKPIGPAQENNKRAKPVEE